MIVFSKTIGKPPNIQMSTTSNFGIPLVLPVLYKNMPQKEKKQYKKESKISKSKKCVFIY